MSLLDSYNREINYLRISVTDRCNYRCFYCMPEKGVKFIDHDKILRYEEIIDFVKVAVKLGINKIKITGGEPLVRKNLIFFIKEITKINGLKDISLTTNGYYLEEYAEQLYLAGIKRINVSIDSLNPEKYKQITKYGDLNKVLKGLEICKKIGFNKIKINTVLLDINKEDIYKIEIFCKKNNFYHQIIKRMDLSRGFFDKVINGEGGKCESCNRLRLTASGYLVPCLFSNIAINIKETSYEKALKKSLKIKPLRGDKNTKFKYFNEIGG